MRHIRPIFITLFLFSAIILGIADSEDMQVFVLTKLGAVIFLGGLLWAGYEESR